MTGHDRIDELESLRGLMALWVVVHHILPTAGIDSGAWRGPLRLLGQGGYAVEVFILLSGFVIFLLLDRAREPFVTFIGRRALRLFPAYLVCLAASVLLVDVALETLHALPWEHEHNAQRMRFLEQSREHFAPHLLAHATLLHGLVPDTLLPGTDYAFMGQAWSISLEWQFYLVAPAFFALAVRRSGAVAAAVAGALAFLGQRYLGASPAFLPAYGYLFLIGAASYALWRAAPRIGLSAPEWSAAIVAGTASVLVTTGSPSLFIWTPIVLALAARRARSAAALARWITWPLSLRPAKALGRISYSVYLSHMVVLYAVAHALEDVAPSLTRTGYLALLLLSVIPIVLALSWVLYRTVEKPCIDLGKRLFAPSAAAQPATARP